MKRVKDLITLASVVVFFTMFMVGVSFASDDAAGLAMYDESAYTEKVEKDMHHMHGLYLRAYDTSLSAKERAKAKKEYFAKAQKLVRSMHDRVMKLDIKTGAALSHTEVLLSTHMTMMMLDMLAAEQLGQ